MGFAAAGCMGIWAARNSPAPGASEGTEAKAGGNREALAGSMPTWPVERATGANSGCCMAAVDSSCCGLDSCALDPSIASILLDASPAQSQKLTFCSKECSGSWM